MLAKLSSSTPSRSSAKRNHLTRAQRLLARNSHGHRAAGLGAAHRRRCLAAHGLNPRRDLTVEATLALTRQQTGAGLREGNALLGIPWQPPHAASALDEHITVRET